MVSPLASDVCHIALPSFDTNFRDPKRGRDTVRVSSEPALPTFDTPKDTGLPTLRSRPKRLTRVGGCRFGYVARHSLVHGFAQCRYLIEQAVEIIARNT